MAPTRHPVPVWLVLVIGIVIGALLAVVAGVALALLRPEGASVLRPWWH